jgi:hypothetical protein
LFDPYYRIFKILSGIAPAMFNTSQVRNHRGRKSEVEIQGGDMKNGTWVQLIVLGSLHQTATLAYLIMDLLDIIISA